MRSLCEFFFLSFAREVQYAGTVSLLEEGTWVLLVIVAIVTLGQLQEICPDLL